MEGGHPLQEGWQNLMWIRLSTHKVTLVGLLNTHHDDQENILEMVPMSKSVLDEKGKVPLQELSGIENKNNE